jgi:SAM-dependent methyltransferase
MTTLTTIARRTVASLPGGLRWRMRNGIALARWLRLRAAGSGADDAYAADFWAFHDSGDWDGFAAAILRFCAPRSIVDVGCGDGKLLAAVRRRAPELTLLGIDSSQPALDRAAAAGVPTAFHDLSSTRRANLDALRARVGACDVAVSLETAEHLPPWVAGGFVETLARVRRVVFSAAQPDQGGTLHMNERPSEYWRARFASRGYERAADDTPFRTAVAALDLPPWYAANVHLFDRRR